MAAVWKFLPLALRYMKIRSIQMFFSGYCSIASSLNSLLDSELPIMPWFNALHCLLLHRRSFKASKKNRKNFFLLLTDTMNLFAFEVNQIIQSVFISISNVVFCSLSCFLWFLKDSLFYFVPLFFFFSFFIGIDSHQIIRSEKCIKRELFCIHYYSIIYSNYSPLEMEATGGCMNYFYWKKCSFFGTKMRGSGSQTSST